MYILFVLFDKPCYRFFWYPDPVAPLQHAPTPRHRQPPGLCHQHRRQGRLHAPPQGVADGDNESGGHAPHHRRLGQGHLATLAERPGHVSHEGAGDCQVYGRSVVYFVPG